MPTKKAAVFVGFLFLLFHSQHSAVADAPTVLIKNYLEGHCAELLQEYYTDCSAGMQNIGLTCNFSSACQPSITFGRDMCDDDDPGTVNFNASPFSHEDFENDDEVGVFNLVDAGQPGYLIVCVGYKVCYRSTPCECDPDGMGGSICVEGTEGNIDVSLCDYATNPSPCVGD